MLACSHMPKGLVPCHSAFVCKSKVQHLKSKLSLLLQDKVDTIRRQCIGVSAHQKLELLTSLARLCGYDSVAVFGDCFDEVCD